MFEGFIGCTVKGREEGQKDLVGALGPPFPLSMTFLVFLLAVLWAACEILKQGLLLGLSKVLCGALKGPQGAETPPMAS